MLVHPKFSFVHIQKTGGTTLETLLRNAFPDAVGWTEWGYARHAWLRQWEPQATGFRFAFVRNPWDRLVSWFSMMRRNASNEPWRTNPLANHFRVVATDFPTFVRDATQRFLIQGAPYSFAMPQTDYMTTRDGRLLVSFVGRFERFERDIRRVFDCLGVPAPASIPKLNPTVHDPYREYYDRRLRRVVEERFAADISRFAYRF